MIDLARLERRVQALENNRGASLRFGKVTGVDEKTGAARVKLPDGEGLVTMPLRVIQRRALRDKAQELPDLGEDVAFLSSGQGFEQGCVLGSFFSEGNPAPGKPPHIWYRIFDDGTEIEYDRETHKMKIKGPCEIEVEAEKNITIHSAKTLTLQGDESIVLATPNLVSGGPGGGAGQAEINGDLKQKGNFETSGNAKVGGDVKAGGKIEDSGGNTNHHSHP